jgi:hypothetical protein
MPTIKDTSLFCCYCGEKFQLGIRRMTSDHLIPLAKGGKNSTYNKRNCCHNCNANKGCMFPEKFLLYNYKKLHRIKKSYALPNISNKWELKAQMHKLEIMIENINYIVEYVQSAGEKLFIDKYFYEDYLEERSFVSHLLKNFTTNETHL